MEKYFFFLSFFNNSSNVIVPSFNGTINLHKATVICVNLDKRMKNQLKSLEVH